MDWNITAGRPVYVQLIEQLQQMHALGMTPAEVEARLRETEASEKE